MCCKKIPYVPFKKVHENAKAPSYESYGAAAADVSCVGWKLNLSSDLDDSSRAIINPGCSIIFDTGLQFAVPEGYEMKVYSRSGSGIKNGIRLSNCTGVLDSDYRGNLMVKLHNDSDTAFVVDLGDRIAQVQIKPAPQHAFVEFDELGSTERGASGFGSTGTN